MLTSEFIAQKRPVHDYLARVAAKDCAAYSSWSFLDSGLDYRR
jgi:hypothetical protein